MRLTLRSCSIFGALLALLSSGPAIQPADGAARLPFVFVRDSGAPIRIIPFRLEGNGQLTSLGAPVDTGLVDGTCGGDCDALAYSRLRKRLFAIGGAGVVGFKLSASGNLTKEATQPLSGTSFSGLEVVEFGNKAFLYAVVSSVRSLVGFRIETNGRLTPLASANQVLPDQAVTLLAVGRRLYASNSASNTVSGFSVSGSGRLSPLPGSPYTIGPVSRAARLAVDPVRSIMLIGDIFVSTAATAPLLPDGSVGAAAAAPGVEGRGSFEVQPGKFLYITQGFGSNLIQSYLADRTGRLAAVGEEQTLPAPVESMGMSPDGRFLVTATGQGGDSVNSYVLDAKIGLVTPADNEAVTLGIADSVLVLNR